MNKKLIVNKFLDFGEFIASRYQPKQQIIDAFCYDYWLIAQCLDLTFLGQENLPFDSSISLLCVYGANGES